MNLDWSVDNCGVLVAKRGNAVFHVRPKAVSLWEANKRVEHPGGVVEIEGTIGGVPLVEAIAWCESLADGRAPLPRPGDASLGTMHEELCRRLGEVEKRVRQQGWMLKDVSKRYDGMDDETGRLDERLSNLEYKVAELQAAHDSVVVPLHDRVRRLEELA